MPNLPTLSYLPTVPVRATRHAFTLLCHLLCFCAAFQNLLWAQTDVVLPKSVGLSSPQLEKLTKYLQSQVNEGRIAGAVAILSRHGNVSYAKAINLTESKQSEPGENNALQLDSLFRIASMTKPITSAAIMSLVEDGAIALDDPLSKHLPEFQNMRVLAQVEGESVKTKAAMKPITIHDLLTHRSGLTYGWFGPEKLDTIYRDHNIPDLFVPTNEKIADRVNRISRVPLKFEPGSSWDYGVSTDVLGRVVEVVSGLTLEQFFYERFFRPLKMTDTMFVVPQEKQDRLASLFTLGKDKQLLPVSNRPTQAGFLRFSSDYCNSGNFYSGGGGLVSSATDYIRFLHMLLRGGELDGVRVLASSSVRAMTQNQIGEMTIPFPGHGDGFGFGFGVVTDRGAGMDEFSVGSYSWGGIFNTYFWVDPQEELVGLLMTQVFPNDQLDVRANFRKLAYAAIDDSGFERLYRYQPGDEHANPHFNSRQLRVNAAEVSTHPNFASRSEARSSGLARILIDEDLRQIRRANLDVEVWGGHPGTARKRITLNGRSTFHFPEVGTASKNCTHQRASFNLRPSDLVNGHNSLQFACDTGDTFWGHYIVDSAALRIGINKQDMRLSEVGLQDFEPKVQVSTVENKEAFLLGLDGLDPHRDRLKSVQYDARYYGYDENGNGWFTDWHENVATTPQIPDPNPAEEPISFSAIFPTKLLHAQQGVEFRAIVKFKDLPDLQYRTRKLSNFSVPGREGERVRLLTAEELPRPFWSRDKKVKNCSINLDVDPDNIVAAELHVVAWTGGAGDVKDYFTLNGQHIPIAEGSDHKTVYSRIPIDPTILKRGKNEIELLSNTKHHGIEIFLPGPALMVRHRIVQESDQGDSSATKNNLDRPIQLSNAEIHGLDCYRIETTNATFYLDKVGAGLASIIDRDGNDWLSFNPQKGTGAGGEYRGFPNAVFKEAGSYFHARNSGTDACSTNVVYKSADRIRISAVSDNGLWAGHYDFTKLGCTFTLTRKPDGHNYWILYEGTPGGEYEDSDWWMSSTEAKKRRLTEKYDDDIQANTGSEWIAFGDDKVTQMLVLSHWQDDSHPDRFYQMQKKMTVFGFGRAGMKKYLKTVPQSFSIGLVDPHKIAGAKPKEFLAAESFSINCKNQDGQTQDVSPAKLNSQSNDINGYEQFALTNPGDKDAGKRIFSDQRTKCATCHRIGDDGGSVGPNLSAIGGKYDRPHLVDALLHPSRQIGYGYETTIIETVDGKIVSGIAKEAEASKITLLNADNKRLSIAKDEIEQTKVSRTSIMPSGIERSLSKQEFTNLIAYLESLGPAKRKWGSDISGPVNLPKGFRLTTIATGLSGAVAMEIATDGRIFICEQDGALRVVKDDVLLDEPFASIPVEMNWERGLIGVTLAPHFPRDPSVYVVYVSQEPYTHHRISRFVAQGDVASPNSERILFRGDDQSQYGGNVPAGHQGGGIHFGPDGKLYVGLGEQTNGKLAQRMDALQGKILRLNPDGSIPEDNPFLQVTNGKYQAIWAKGCRNPFTFAFDEQEQMLINDVGGKFEEINRGLAGANYGWPVVEHGPTDRKDITGPIHIYPQSSIGGADFCDTDSKWPNEYHNKFFFADFIRGWIKFIDPESPKKAINFVSGIRQPVDLRFAPDGSLYVLLRNAWVVDKKFEGGTSSLIKISYHGDL